MGSPIVLDTFHSDRWDYLYTISRDGGKVKRRRITLFFAEDKLARVEGDVKPAAGRLVVDTRQDMTVDVPEPEAEGLISKLKDNIPFVGEEEIPKKPVEKTGVARVVEAEDALPTARKLATKPTITPVQRAALEEQEGPGVLAKLKDAIPFTGDQATGVAGVDPERESAAVDRQEVEDDEAPMADAKASPGLLARLKGAMPFTGDTPPAAPGEGGTHGTAEDAARDGGEDAHASDDESEDEDGYAGDDESEDEDEYAEDGESEDAAGLAEEEEEARVVLAPPVAPTSMPLENQLATEPTARRTKRDEGVEVPAERTAKKRGFFARLFGRDRPEPAEQPDNRERRRYRDIADPDSE